MRENSGEKCQFPGSQDDGIARAEAAMRHSTQSDAAIKEVLKVAQTRVPSQKEIAFFAKHGCVRPHRPPPRKDHKGVGPGGPPGSGSRQIVRDENQFEAAPRWR